MSAKRPDTLSAGAHHPPDLRVLLAEENPSMRRSLRRLLDDADEIRVVAEPADLAAVEDALRAFGADVIVLDLRLHGGNVLDFIRAHASRPRPVSVVGTTMSRNSLVAAEALRAGAEAVVLKDHADEQLAAAVKAAASASATGHLAAAVRLIA